MISILYACFAVMSAFNTLSIKNTSVNILWMNKSFFASQAGIIGNTSLALLRANVTVNVLLISKETFVTVTAVVSS